MELEADADNIIMMAWKKEADQIWRETQHTQITGAHDDFRLTYFCRGRIMTTTYLS